jgi:hypothetical protein
MNERGWIHGNTQQAVLVFQKKEKQFSTGRRKRAKPERQALYKSEKEAENRDAGSAVT